MSFPSDAFAELLQVHVAGAVPGHQGLRCGRDVQRVAPRRVGNRNDGLEGAGPVRAVVGGPAYEVVIGEVERLQAQGVPYHLVQLVYLDDHERFVPDDVGQLVGRCGLQRPDRRRHGKSHALILPVGPPPDGQASGKTWASPS